MRSVRTRAPKKLIVVVPAYNEAGRIAETVTALKAVSGSLAGIGLNLGVYVVDDGSSDATRKLARGADKVLRHKINQGLGAAVRTGLTAARADDADIAVKFDADLQHDPADIVALVRPILDGDADLVYGHRFDRIEYRMPTMRRAGNRVFTCLMRMLTGWPIKDGQPGIFAVGRDYLEVFHLPGDYNYTQQILLDAFHKGMRFAHVPVRFRKRTTGRSFISLKYPFKVGYQILQVRAAARPMKGGSDGFLSLFAAFIASAVDVVLSLLGRSPKPAVRRAQAMRVTRSRGTRESNTRA